MKPYVDNARPTGSHEERVDRSSVVGNRWGLREGAHLQKEPDCTSETCGKLVGVGLPGAGSLSWVQPTERWGEQGIVFRGPHTFKGPHEAFILMIFTFWAASSHCFFFVLSFAFLALSGLKQ